MRDEVWNSMSGTYWNDTLYNFDFVQLDKSVGKSNDEELTNDESCVYPLSGVCDSGTEDWSAIANESINDKPTIDIEFQNKRELYNHYESMLRKKQNDKSKDGICSKN
mgnify:CR=1 FL=1